MDAIEYLKNHQRMCRYYDDTVPPCIGCPIFPGCSELESESPAEAVKIVAQWAAEHPEEEPDPVKQNALRIGAPAVLEQTAEECAELAVALKEEYSRLKIWSGKHIEFKAKAHIREEITDVEICLDMLDAIGYGVARNFERVAQKDERTCIFDAMLATPVLAHACLKEARRLRGENPTPKPAEKCKREIEDGVLLIACQIAILAKSGYTDSQDLRETKIQRMTERLDARR